MKTVTSGVVAAATAALLQLSAPAVNATVVQYCGPNLCYEYDDAQAAVTYYGLPGFAGDDAYFLPSIFEARSTDGVGMHAPFGNTDFVDSTWVFDRVWTINPNNEIASIYAFEEGDYEITLAAGDVSGDLYLRAFGLNAVEPTVIDTDSVNFAGNSGGVQLWNMAATIGPAGSLTQVANNLSLTIQNQLSAFTPQGSTGVAWIEKKLILEINTLIPVAQIPVPAAVWLLGSAFGVMTLVRRRVA